MSEFESRLRRLLARRDYSVIELTLSDGTKYQLDQTFEIGLNGDAVELLTTDFVIIFPVHAVVSLQLSLVEQQ
jgi:hypothetical protein